MRNFYAVFGWLVLLVGSLYGLYWCICGLAEPILRARVKEYDEDSFLDAKQISHGTYFYVGLFDEEQKEAERREREEVERKKREAEELDAYLHEMAERATQNSIMRQRQLAALMSQQMAPGIMLPLPPTVNANTNLRDVVYLQQSDDRLPLTDHLQRLSVLSKL